MDPLSETDPVRRASAAPLPAFGLGSANRRPSPTQPSPFGQRQYDSDSDTEADDAEEEGDTVDDGVGLRPSKDHPLFASGPNSDASEGSEAEEEEDVLPLAPPPPPPPPASAAAAASRAGGGGARRMSKRELLDSQAAWADSSPAAGRTGKRRATQVFVNDPNMLGTIQQVRRDIEAEQATGPGDAAAAGGAGGAARGADEAPRARRERLASDAVDGFMTSASQRGRAEADGEERLQELRGIFAAFDDDKDGFVNRRQLGDALYALGIIPTDSVLQMFLLQSKFSPRVDLPTFLRVAAERLHGKETVEEDIAEVFTMFDKAGTGSIAAGVLRHIMTDVDMPGAMNPEEVEEFFAFAGLEDVKSDVQLDYASLVKSLTW